jgi:putative endonuclease
MFARFSAPKGLADTSPKREIDMVGYDGPTLAFVEVKTRSKRGLPQSGTGTAQLMPEEAVNWEKRRNLSRMARQFVRIRCLESVAHRFDILAIESRIGSQAGIRLHKGVFHA